jgi:hypothetical protein
LDVDVVAVNDGDVQIGHDFPLNRCSGVHNTIRANKEQQEDD